jgi:CheY-like chemotaxis protein
MLANGGGLTKSLSVQREERVSELRAHTDSEDILIVADDPDLAEAASASLSAAGYNVQVYADGVAAMQDMKGGPRPDLILLDLTMPGMSGWEFRAQQRFSADWCDIPLVVLSAKNSVMARAIDADGLLTKPLEPAHLLEVTRRVLQASKSKYVEARAQELERLSSLGTLAAGLAHEVNNPLAILLGYVQVLRNSLTPRGSAPSHERVDQALDNIEHAATRIGSVVRELANFARSQDVSSADVTQVLEGCARLVANRIRMRGQLERTYDKVPPVAGNPARLGQVFLTLLIRAVHLLELDDRPNRFIRLAIKQSASGLIAVSITDSGPGPINPIELQRIFLPSRSRKMASLAVPDLYLANTIIQDLGGTMSATGTPQGGTTFELLLPALESSGEEVSEASKGPVVRGKGRARIFVIDDEVNLCSMLELLLSDSYDVTTESDPALGLERLLREPPTDLVLCDLMMPKLSGRQIYETLQVRRPELASRIMFMTGGAFTEAASDFLGKFPASIMKPFDVRELVDAIEKRLVELGRVDGQATA